MVKEEYPMAAKQLLGPILPSWLEAFRTIFAESLKQGNTGDSLMLRFEIVKVHECGSGPSFLPSCRPLTKSWTNSPNWSLPN